MLSAIWVYPGEVREVYYLNVTQSIRGVGTYSLDIWWRRKNDAYLSGNFNIYSAFKGFVKWSGIAEFQNAVSSYCMNM
jgi:hypothetical protein